MTYMKGEETYEACRIQNRQQLIEKTDAAPLSAAMLRGSGLEVPQSSDMNFVRLVEARAVSSM